MLEETQAELREARAQLKVELAHEEELKRLAARDLQSELRMPS